MAGREVREYTNLTDPKDRKWGKGKDKIDDEDITFQRMVAKMQEVAGERGGYLHGRGALDSDDLLYLKEQMEAEEDAERLLRRTEKRAFAAFKKAASLADSAPAPLPLPLRVELKPKSAIRQQDILKNIVGIKLKRPRLSSPSNQVQSEQTNPSVSIDASTDGETESRHRENTSSGSTQINRSSIANSQDKTHVNLEQKLEKVRPLKQSTEDTNAKPVNVAKSLLGLSYGSSDEDD